MTTTLKVTIGVGVAVLGLFLAAGRSLSGMWGYTRASAEGTVERLEHSLPQEVHDRKLQHELTQARREVIDRQVQLNQSKTQINQLRDDVRKLTSSLEVRKKLLTEAYPVLEQSERCRPEKVRFAGADYGLAEFQHEVDELMTMQESEQRQLAIKQQGLTRLETSEREAEAALTEMRRALEGAELEVTVLKSRREQAEIESRTLDMVDSVAAGSSAATDNVGKSLDRLRGDVTRIEAENDAKRTLAPADAKTSTNRLARNWNRLESLKKLSGE